jgi:hypothetical protein
LEGTVARGLRVPEPVDSNGFSGKLVVRLPKTLHKKAAHVAAREGVSLNSFIVSSLAEQVGTRSGSALRIATTGGNYTQNINAFFVSAASPTSSSGAGMALTATTEAKAGLLKNPWGTVHA